MAERIETKLRDSLTPAHLEVHDDSHKHEGHAGARPGGETHFRVVVAAAAFEGKSRVARQRLVYGALAEEMQERVHALQLTTLTPEEHTRRSESARG